MRLAPSDARQMIQPVSAFFAASFLLEFGLDHLGGLI
jgi:hypothetical protein